MPWRTWTAGWLLPTGGPSARTAGIPQHLLVIGMGKLGGEELNVSSDVDLIFLYPEEGESTGPRPLSGNEYFTRLGRKLINALGAYTADGHVFRVDMRLRPYGESGPLAMSFAMLENYLLSQGREWERYAWVKAREITGQPTQELMQLVTPFVYRRHLDFSAIASLRELHAQIRTEVARRDLHDNIKLGAGGIREIEFVAQVFQLVRGGRDAGLRLRSTLGTLDCLAQRRLLPAQAVEELRCAYVFLRTSGASPAIPGRPADPDAALRPRGPCARRAGYGLSRHDAPSARRWNATAPTSPGSSRRCSRAPPARRQSIR